jgi:two-component system, NtrC family, sensor histidine kinase HydH
MVAALAFWSWRVWQDIDGRRREGERFRATDFSNVLTGALQALFANEDLSREEIKRILDGIVRNSPYQFFVLEQNGRRILQTGNLPAALSTSPEKEGRPDENLFIFRRKVQLLRGEGRETVPKAPAAADEARPIGLERGEQLMIFGGDIHEDPFYSEAVKGILVLHAGAILLLTASFAAWVMAIRSRLLAEQLRAERARSAHLEDLGLAAAGLAHETKNPLGIISGIAQQVARNPEVPEQSRSMIETIIDEVDKSASRLGRFMTFARRQEINKVPLDIRKLVSRIAEILQPEFDAAGVTLEVDCPPMTVLADEDMLRQILVNLLLNSLQASSPGNRVMVRMERHGGLANLVVEDQGRGIPPELLPNIFKPYVAGNPEGHGLGLAIVKRFVEEHRWTITAESQCRRGTAITVRGIVPAPAREG